jgi:hypothetical protein
MPLIDLKTSLKSLKFGKDRPYEGSSNQPYIQSSIPEGDIPTSGGTDFLLRGGILAPINAAKDVSRLTQMFFDLKSPNGFQFITKQNILSRTSVQTEASTGAGYGGNFVNQGVYLPSSTLAQAGLGFTGTHLNLFGIDPSSPMAGITQTSLSSLFFNKSDSKSILTLGLNRYEDIVKKNNEIEKNIIGDTVSLNQSTTSLTSGINPNVSNAFFTPLDLLTPVAVKKSVISNRLLKLWNEKEQKESIELLSYPGGPGSILGVGQTIIPFADQRTGINNPTLKKDGFFVKGNSIFISKTTKELSNPSQTPAASKINYRNAVPSGSIKGVSSKYENLTKQNVDNFIVYNNNQQISTNNFNVYQPGTFEPSDLSKTQTGLFKGTSIYTYDQSQLIDASNNNIKQAFKEDFRKPLIPSQSSFNTILSISPSYIDSNYAKRTNAGDPGFKNTAEGIKNVLNYTQASGNGIAEDYKIALDKITAGAIYSATTALHNPDNGEYAGNDLVKFSIGVVKNDASGSSNFMHFRAFIDSFSDSYSSNWGSYNYVGRGDKFYNYEGFERTINLSFTVFAQSKAELIPMYKKLNYLASSLAPDYSNSGFMKGNLHKLTIGGYLFDQVGIIKSITYDIPEETPWEIGINNQPEVGYDTSVKELPHMIKVTNLSFIPIQHFLPRVADLRENQKTTRYIALATNTSDDDTNYTKYKT